MAVAVYARQSVEKKNSISIEGSTDIAFTENVEKRMEAFCVFWSNVIHTNGTCFFSGHHRAISRV